MFFVKPENDINCTYQPSCLTLNEYVTQKEQYFLDNTTFMFLPGFHQLDVQLNVENLSNISFIGTEEPLVQVSLSEAVNITLINCDNIELSRLVFFVEGDGMEIISALYFHRVIGVLSYLSFLGNGPNKFRAMLFNDSEIMIYNIHVNRASSDCGAALCCLSSTITLHGHNKFTNNHVFWDGGAVELFNCTSMFFGSMSFLNNTAVEFGGAVSIYGDGYSFFSGNIFMVENKAYLGGAMAIMGGSSKTKFFGNISFINNSASSNGGAMFLAGGISTFTENISFINNTAVIGGAMAVVRWYEIDITVVNFTGFSKFEGNAAQQGGAMAFFRGSKLMLSDPLLMKFVDNHAELTGGAIFFGNDIDDTVSNHCTKQTLIKMGVLIPCFIEFGSLENIHLTFRENTAGDAGPVLYGTDLYSCKVFTGCGAKDSSCENSINSAHINLPNTIRNISDIISDDDITSDPLRVRICDNYYQLDTLNLDTIPGKELKLEAMVVGQGGNAVPSFVRILQNNDVQVGSNQLTQPTGKQCTPIRYRFFASVKKTNVTLFPNNCISGVREMSSIKLNITFLPCPDGFALEGSKCTCEERLTQFNVSCHVDDSSIERTTNSYWIGTIYDNDKYEGLILHSGGCPFDYCLDTPANITLDSLDSQCNYNHTGMLCGPCRDNHSIAFGTLHCLACSNAYLALLLPFAAMGAALVAMLLLLNLSVAVGMIHGVIFYANVVQAARSTFFPPGETNILTVFIAWLNLDLGIESCFYDGMNAYAFTWLQFLFPFYIWFLIGLLIVVSHFSRKISESLGNNPVATLATLFLLSYSKILRNIIAVLSVTSLQCPDGSNKLVWLYDGSVPYFQRPDHIFLGIFALLLLVFLFFPYTLLLLCGHWFQAYSDWKIFSWANKLKPFMDAYHAPYKRETRYWPGLVLLVRCAMFAAFTLTSLDNSHFELLLITSLTVGLAALAWAHRGVYESFHSDLLEASFILNLCILAAATYYVQQTGGSQAALAYTSISVAFVMFIFIVLYHLYLAVRKTSTWKKFIQSQSVKKCRVLISQLQGNENVDTVDEEKVPSAATLSLNIPTTVVELREPLLTSTRN